MQDLLIIGAIILATLYAERRRLRKYWKRSCTGRAWKRRFPSASKGDIRDFLSLFTAAFAFRERRRLAFSPDDKPMEVYRALYPLPQLVGDAMELETFIEGIRARYNADLLPLWREDITLGELYAAATATGRR